MYAQPSNEPRRLNFGPCILPNSCTFFLLNVRCYFQVLETFTEKVSEYRRYEGLQPISRNESIKFVMARKFDYLRAVELYRAHQVQ